MSIEPKLPQAVAAAMPAVTTPVPLGGQSLSLSGPRTKPVLVAQTRADAPAVPQPDVNAAQNEIVIPVSVVEPAGRYVTGLDGSSFRITEGSDVEPITSVNPSAGQHAIAVLHGLGDVLQ